VGSACAAKRLASQIFAEDVAALRSGHPPPRIRWVGSRATARPSCDRDIGYLNIRQPARTTAAPKAALMKSAIDEFERVMIVAR